MKNRTYRKVYSFLMLTLGISLASYGQATKNTNVKEKTDVLAHATTNTGTAAKKTAPATVVLSTTNGGKFCSVDNVNPTVHFVTDGSEVGYTYELRKLDPWFAPFGPQTTMVSLPGTGAPLDFGTPVFTSGLSPNNTSDPFILVVYETAAPFPEYTMGGMVTFEWLATPILNSDIYLCPNDTLPFYSIPTFYSIQEPWGWFTPTMTKYVVAEDTAVAYGSSDGLTVFAGADTGRTTFRLRTENGCISNPTQIIVQNYTDPSFTVNDLTQELTGNSFAFTVTGSTGWDYQHAWSFGDGSSLGYTGANNATHTYSAEGIYDVTHSSYYTDLFYANVKHCRASATIPVSVLSDDVGGSGGGSGGLESESLGGLVSKRDFNRIKNSEDKQVDYTKAIAFTKPGVAAKGSASPASRLQHLLPASLNAATTAVISSPEDITTITKAVDVFSLDYIASNRAKAVALGITTLERPYSHTKSVCDRFKGSTLLRTETVKIHGFDFIRFALQQEDGTMEFCIAFDAGKSAGRSTIDLQTSWLIGEYKGDDSVFNFQVWAADPANTVALTEKILSNLEAMMPLQQVDTAFAQPKAYIASGRRSKGNLELTITNGTPITSAELRFEERLHEQANVSERIIPLTLTQGKDNKISVEINDGYEYPGYLYLNGRLVDAVYLADGNWSLDYDGTYTKLSQYKTENDPARQYKDNEYPVYRSLAVKATSADYMMAYKFIAAGSKPVDLSGHRTLKFHAEGSGKMTVMLTKDGITKFASQYSTTVQLVPGGKDYAISFDDFTSGNGKTPFTAEDVTAVVFAWTFGGKETDFQFKASEIAFSPDEVMGQRLLKVKTLNVAPNPTNGVLQLKFQSETDTEYDVLFLDVTGRLVYKEKVKAVLGANSVNLTLPAQLARPAQLMVTMGNERTHYQATKLIVTE